MSMKDIINRLLIPKRYKNIVAWIYVMAIFWIIPLYNKGTYDGISQCKIEVFYLISGLSLALYTAGSLIADLRNSSDSENGSHKSLWEKMSATDIMLSLFVLSAGLSTVLSRYRKESIYGVPGFGMGTLSLVILVLSFFFISRNMQSSDIVFHLLALSSVMPTVLTIINRLGYDPLHIYPVDADTKTHLYVSTIGNYGWYCEYMSVIVPIALYMLLNCAKITVKLIYGIFLAVVICALSLAGTKVIVLSITVSVIIVLFQKFHKTKFFVKANVVAIIMGCLFVLYVWGILFASKIPEIANGRGYIWNTSIHLFRSLPVWRWFIGVGPNCYMYALNDYLVIHTDESVVFAEKLRGLALTSAHSEMFDYLINMGIVGLVAYLGFIYSLIASYLCGEKVRSSRTDISFVCIISYIVYTAFNFSIVCSTPMFFVFSALLMIGSNEEVFTVEE